MLRRWIRAATDAVLLAMLIVFYRPFALHLVRWRMRRLIPLVEPGDGRRDLGRHEGLVER